MSDLPKGWATPTIGSVIELNPKNDCDDTTEVGFVPMPLMGTSYRESVRYERKAWANVKRGYTHFADGDVLLAKITPCFENGKGGLALGLPNGLGAGSTEYFVCRPHASALHAKYLLAYFKTRQFMQNGAVEMTGSVGHKRVPKDYVTETTIPLAPLPEQKRIAYKLDSTLARVDACRDRLDRLPALLKRFRQSVLAAATSGRLTEDWREQHAPIDMASTIKALSSDQKARRGVAEDVMAVSEYIESWSYPTGWWSGTAAALLCKGVFVDLKDGNHGANHPVVSDFTLTGLPFITAAQVERFTIDYDGAYKVSGAPLAKLRVGFAKPDDVVLTHKGSVGRLGIADRECVLTPQTTYYRTNHNYVAPKYLMYYMASQPFSGQLDEIKSQTTRDFVPITQQYALVHLIPSTDEQHEIVRRVETLFAFADRLEARLATARKQAEQLTPALLAKAFRGELVPQDPNDEPASELIKRLAASRTDAPKPRRGRKAAA